MPWSPDQEAVGFAEERDKGGGVKEKHANDRVEVDVDELLVPGPVRLGKVDDSRGAKEADAAHKGRQDGPVVERFSATAKEETMTGLETEMEGIDQGEAAWRRRVRPPAIEEVDGKYVLRQGEPARKKNPEPVTLRCRERL